ncbi:MAG: cupin domain-containing protein [Steroidobacteraceae bacterium]
MTNPSDRCSKALAALLIGALAEGPPALVLTARRRELMRDRMLAQAAGAAPQLTETVRGESLPWNQAWPGVWARVLKQDGAEDLQITLFRMEPGSVVPGHGHAREEECLVLQGELIIGPHRIGEGDLHIARPGARHPDITTQRGALLLVRSEIPRVT